MSLDCIGPSCHKDMSAQLTAFQLLDLIKDNAVALRLKAGSDEAGYLAQIFPLPQTPTVVIMKHGELKEYLTPATNKEDFIRRVQNAFSCQPRTSSPSSRNDSAAGASSAPTPATQHAIAGDTSVESRQQSDNVRRVLAERAARLQAEKEASEAKAKEKRAQAKEKAKADAEVGADSDAARAHQQAELAKKKRLQEQEERRRILKRIADDKAERRVRAAEKELQKIENQRVAFDSSSSTDAPRTKLPVSTRVTDMVSLQIRLFDGSVMRSRFKTSSCLRDVRKWADENRTDGGEPYVFKHILTPLPNKTVDEMEESRTLDELGLAPSATLVLVPVSQYSTAYAAAGSGNIFSNLFGTIMALLIWLLGLVGLGGHRENRRVSEREGQRREPAHVPRKRRAQRPPDTSHPRRDHQLYNGNSVRWQDLFYIYQCNTDSV